MRVSKLHTFRALAFLCLFATVATQAGAVVLTFEASIEFSGGAAPVGVPPWVSVVLDDQGGAGSVLMSVTATNLTASEFISELCLNLDPVLDPTDLVFSLPTKVGAFDAPTISLGANSFKADGDGKYDLLLGFATSGGGAPSPTRFEGGESVAYIITGIPSLTALSFYALSAPSGGHGPYMMAAHVQGIGAEGALSGWVAPDGVPPIPEPATISLLALGGFALLRRK